MPAGFDLGIQEKPGIHRLDATMVIACSPKPIWPVERSRDSENDSMQTCKPKNDVLLLTFEAWQGSCFKVTIRFRLEGL